MRDTRIVESLLEVRILHLLRVAELLHEEHQSLCAALLHKIRNELAAAILCGLRIIEQDIVIAICELHGEVSDRVVGLRRIGLEETALVCHIVRCDCNVVVVENLQELRVVADDTARHNLAARPLCSRQLLKLCIELFEKRNVLALCHEPSRFQHLHSLDCRNHIAVLACELHKTARRTAVTIVELDARLQCLRRNCLRSNLLKLALDLVILVHRELQTPLRKTVLRMCKEDGRHLAAHCHADVLGHRAQRIADGRRNHAVQLIEGAV